MIEVNVVPTCVIVVFLYYVFLFSWSCDEELRSVDVRIPQAELDEQMKLQ